MNKILKVLFLFLLIPLIFSCEKNERILSQEREIVTPVAVEPEPSVPDVIEEPELVIVQKEPLPDDPDTVDSLPVVNSEDPSNLLPPLIPEEKEELTIEIGQVAILPDDWKNFVRRSSERIDPPGKDPERIAVVPEEPELVDVAVPEEPSQAVAASPEEVEEQVFIAVASPEPEEPVAVEETPEAQVQPEEPDVVKTDTNEEPLPAAETNLEVQTPVEAVMIEADQVVETAAVEEVVEAVPDQPVLPEGGPQILLKSPLPQDYYRGSLLLEGECLPGPGVNEEEGRVRSLSWKIPTLGDWSNTVFMEEDGSFQMDLITASLEGPQTLILESEDFAGRISRQTILLQDGNQPPQILTEREDPVRTYGAQLSLKGILVDPYEGIAGLEGIRSLSYRMVPQDRTSGEEVLSGTIPLTHNEFFIAINMADRVGEQVLQLEALGENESRGRLEIRLIPGFGDIPSFSLEPQDGRLVFSWEEIPEALEQNIYLTDQADGDPVEIPTVQFNNVQSPLIINGTVNGRLYRAKLEVLTEEERYWSEIAEAIPLAPGTLELKAQGGFEQVILSWNPIPGASTFRIWRKSNEDEEFKVLVDQLASEEYIDATASFGTSYTYRIEPAAVKGPLSYEVSASSVEKPSDKITLSSHYRQIFPEKITVLGDYAYVAAGDGGFHIMDISTPQKPESIGFLDQKGVEDVYLGEEYVYLASGDQGFQVVNIEEPTKPFFVLSRVTPNALSIAGRDNLVFVADENLGLQIFDITDRLNPQRVSSLRELKVSQLDLEGSLLYAATGEGGMILLDISNPYSPEIINSFVDYPVYDILVKDEMIYLACGNRGMVILEQSGPGQWQELSHYLSDDARMIRLWEDYAMIADGLGGLQAVDISRPSDPQYFGTYRGSEIKALAMADDYALLADISGLKVVRTYLFGQSFVQQNWTTPGRAYGVVADGNRLWVADRQGGVSVYEAASPERMDENSLLRNFASDFAEDFMVKDDLLYIADGPGGLKLFRLSDPSRTPMVQVPLSGRARRILPYGSQIVVISSEEGLIFLDEVPEGPNTALSLSFESRFYSSDPRDALFYGSTLFVGDAQEGLVVAQKLNGQFFELERYGEYEGIKQLLLHDDILYVLHSKGITLMDIQNPESPRVLSVIHSDVGESMQIEDEYLYLAEGFKGLSIYRISDTLQPLKVSVCEDLFALDAAPSGSYAYVADMDGVSVVKIIIPDWK
jgi:hypothetical protein